MNKIELFPTTIIEFDFTNHLNLNDILKVIENTETTEHNLINNGNSSITFPNLLNSPYLILLKNDFQKCVDLYCNELQIETGYICESWFNIMEKEGKINTHNHGPSIVSGAFYPLLEENTCNLTFKSPLHTSLNFVNIEGNNHFQKDIMINVKQNHLYLFPGWLDHYTEKNKGNKRIVISFNTKFY